ncbi:cytochrome C assembly family protein [Elongatibacter sediminis]|uniref:Cytochrome c biogenesis protein CcsA n=1 Tax=Elongatibacter sediminis TaxID=3119006 RepID=A0AAW9R6F1_9GAMM
MNHDTTLLYALGLYAAATALLYRSIITGSRRWRHVSLGAALAGAALHGAAQWQHWSTSGMPDVGFLNLLSLCALVIVVMLCLSALSRDSLFDASLVALPLAVLVLILEWSLPSERLLVEIDSWGTAAHIVSSVLAFGLFSIAGVYALFVVAIDHFLRSHHLNPLVQALPALDVLERLLFRLLGAGFVLLTVSLATGLAYVQDLFAQHLAHKTLLSFLAWFVFGTLLLGRWRYGWRGRRAVWLSLAGVVLLLLAYFGSKLVLEVILDRNWWV